MDSDQDVVNRQTSPVDVMNENHQNPLNNEMNQNNRNRNDIQQRKSIPSSENINITRNNMAYNNLSPSFVSKQPTTRATRKRKYDEMIPSMTGVISSKRQKIAES